MHDTDTKAGQATTDRVPPAGPSTVHADRMDHLRGELTRRALDGFIIPLTDEHMSEYVGDYAQRLAYMTGFTGSAGTAVVLRDKAAIFVDGRYTLQVEDQVDHTLFERCHMEAYPLDSWIIDNADAKARIGYDPTLCTPDWVQKIDKALRDASLRFETVDDNPVDTIWHDRPAPSLAPAIAHDDDFAGISAAAKRGDIASLLKNKKVDCAVLTMLDSVAWAFNIRGRDVPHTPVTHAFGLLNVDGTAILFIDDRKIDTDLRTHLGNSVRIEPRERFYETLTQLGSAGKRVLVDPAVANAKVVSTLENSGAVIVEDRDPCSLPKARKNAMEQAGARNAHIRDGAALTEFLAWLDTAIEDGAAVEGRLDELGLVDRLWAFRQKRNHVTDSSFDTISGSGPNGAVIHYRVTEETNRKLQMGELYLLDSGAQYLDGTTDVTRTIPVGQPTEAMQTHFTLVLKGHIQLALTRFPMGTSGQALDSIARRPLWQAGLDYDHGTGHGVGSFLGVHEGPQRIAKFGTDIPLEEGMILSNEPGYYKTGAYGIRIENLILVQRSGKEEERPMLFFETLTLVPIDRRLIRTELLSDAETDWVNQYHDRVRTLITPHVENSAHAWLERATAPLSAGT